MKKILLLTLFSLCLLTNVFAQKWSVAQTWNNENKSKLFGRLIQNTEKIENERMVECDYSIMNSNDFSLKMLLMVEYIDENGLINQEIVYEFILPGRRYFFKNTIEEAQIEGMAFTKTLTEYLDTHIVTANEEQWSWFPQKNNKYYGYPFQNLFFLFSLENEDESSKNKVGWWRIGGISRKDQFELPPKASFLTFYIVEESN